MVPVRAHAGPGGPFATRHRTAFPWWKYGKATNKSGRSHPGVTNGRSDDRRRLPFREAQSFTYGHHRLPIQYGPRPRHKLGAQRTHSLRPADVFWGAGPGGAHVPEWDQAFG
jgi:hypothetical protein